MNIVFFLSIFTAFLFFCAFYVLSPKRNPDHKALLAHEKAPSAETLEIAVYAFVVVGILITLGLIAMVPFLRTVAAIAMVGVVVRFFYRRHPSNTSFAWTDQDPRPAAKPLGDDD